MRSILLMLAGACLSAACDTPSETTPRILADIGVDAGRFDRTDALVSVPLEMGFGPVHVVETTADRAIPTPSQYDPVTGTLVWVLEGDLEAGGKRTYAVREGTDPHPRRRQRVTVHDPDGRALEVRVTGERVLRYNCALVFPNQPDVPDRYARNAYLHPVWAPSGRSVSDDFHPGHLHQRGIFMAWTETRFDERTPDFWNLGEKTGTVRFVRLGEQSEGPVFGGFRAYHQHIDLSAPEGEEVVLDETWDLRVYAMGGRDLGFFLFDVVSSQTNVTSKPLFLPEYHYGGMAVRGAREWTPENLNVRTGSGKSDRSSADGSRENWILMEGPIGDPRGGPAGIAVFSHPDNVRAPQPLRMHPEMPYFAFTPQRAGDMQITPGESVTQIYRFLVYDGSPPPALLDSYWHDFADPPLTEVSLLESP